MPVDLNHLRAIDPNKLYTPQEVGLVFGRSAAAVILWIKAGRLQSVPDPIDARRYWVRGYEMLALAGGWLAIESAEENQPVSKTDWNKRVSRAAAEFARLTRRK